MLSWYRREMNENGSRCSNWHTIGSLWISLYIYSYWSLFPAPKDTFDFKLHWCPLPNDVFICSAATRVLHAVNAEATEFTCHYFICFPRSPYSMYCHGSFDLFDQPFWAISFYVSWLHKLECPLCIFILLLPWRVHTLPNITCASSSQKTALNSSPESRCKCWKASAISLCARIGIVVVLPTLHSIYGTWGYYLWLVKYVL